MFELKSNNRKVQHMIKKYVFFIVKGAFFSWFQNNGSRGSQRDDKQLSSTF